MRPLPLLLLLTLPLCDADDPDHTGLVASPAMLLSPDVPLTLPLRFWANSRKSALKPRRRDLHEPTLLSLLGQDYDARWMRTAKYNNKPVRQLLILFLIATLPSRAGGL